jgi:hypothetical protein
MTVSILYQAKTLSLSLIFIVKQLKQSKGRDITPSRHIILIPNQSVFAVALLLLHAMWETVNAVWFDPTGVQTHD